MPEKKKPSRFVVASERKAQAHNVRLRTAFLFFIAVVLSFSGGFLLSRNDKVLEALGLAAAVNSVLPASDQAGESSTSYSLAARIAEVENILNLDSLDSYDLEEASVMSLEAFSEITSDPYLTYYSPSRYEELLAGENVASTAGIGVLFSESNGNACVVDVFEDSAAQQIGIQVGDVVVALNGDRDRGCSMIDVASFLKVHEGEEVIITWQRTATGKEDGSEAQEEFTTTLLCSHYDEENLSYELAEDGIGYISLHQITQDSAELLGNAVLDLESQGASAYVLDLRNNPGGYLSQTVDIASLFMDSGTVVRVRTKSSGDAPRNVSGSTVTSKPLVVIVNGGTSSSAEVLAAALQDSGRATVVGETSLGKGSVQVMRDLSFGGALKYTAATYVTPKGHLIEGVGVLPDIKVTLTDGSDNQKTLALETASSLVKA